MRKRGSIVCKLRPCLPKGPTNFARMRIFVTAALQRQYLQTELILWIRLVSLNFPRFMNTVGMLTILSRILVTVDGAWIGE
jgi:hypothetical protein